MFLIAPLPLADRLSLVLEGLCRAVAARIAGGALSVVMIHLIWRRVRQVEGRIQRLLMRFRAGRLWFRAQRPGRLGSARRAVVTTRLPRRFGWLLPLVPQHAAGFASQLRGVLADPEMVALLSASPQAGRVLAPLCRMLAIEAEVLGRAPAVAVPRDPPVKPKRVRKPRAKVDWGRVPLPRGVLSWARREGFGKPPRD